MPAEKGADIHWLQPTANGVFDLKHLLAQNAVKLSILLQARGLFLDIAISTNTPRFFRGNPLLVEQIINSLVQHSMTELDHGGITIRVNTVDLTPQGHHTIQLAINESSQGMLPEELTALQRSLEQLELPATARIISPDLLEAAKLIESVHGKLDVESDFGWGTRYLVTLRLRPARATRSSGQN